MQAELDGKPPTGDEPEKIRRLQLTMKTLHNKISELNEEMIERAKGKPEGTTVINPNWSIVREPEKFDGTKPKYFWV